MEGPSVAVGGEGAPLDEFVPDGTVSPRAYEPFIGRDRVEQLELLASTVAGRSWINLNSTLIGGGVAEMLRSVIPLARGLGVDAHWHVIRGNDEFFAVTKKFHNLLQGVDQPLELEEIFGAYLDTIDTNARDAFFAADLMVIHDPQPVALVMSGLMFGNVLWRCHIDTSAPNRIVWRFLLPYINMCAGAIFTMPEFVGPGLHVPIYQITPAIDPLAEKNRQYQDDEALEVLAPLFEQHDIDPRRPVVAAISRYDVHKNQTSILDTFRRLREMGQRRRPPYLIFMGNTATDDPEGGAMLAKLKAQADGDPDVRFWVNVQDNDRVVGALMRHADVFVHLSTREGFGLVVSEALWQGTPVIGSRVGGITKQVIDGQTGYLVDPTDVETAARRLASLLDRPDVAARFGENGREHVRHHFLLPELVCKYLMLLQHYSGQTESLPPFRLDGLAYSECVQAIRPRHPILRQ